MSQTCSKLVPLLKNLQTLQGSFGVVLEKYIQTGAVKDKEELNRLKEQIKTAQDEYELAGREKVTVIDKEGESKQVIAKHAVILEYMKSLIENFRFSTNSGCEVIVINVEGNKLTDQTAIKSLGFINKISTLQKFNCPLTQISELPSLPNYLLELYCAETQISKLPPLPSSLQYLFCSQTQISELPTLPNSLLELYCSETPITKLPPLPDSLRTLNCSQTQITELPPLPDSITYINIQNTTAAKNSKTIVQLKEFKAKHPNVEVHY